ncbi:hypothetical protein LWF01_06315 [Saxibacter everestensis]|uniref:Sarcosine oxidase subunit gamma n=1 Tax=Saxibacter everestensis TaxID=2909229 RepID=A0ABY8QYU5_9MICO|nr:hypothetical protein LWF01_06315 [Brevibacteriaceae bacterium ZFBP1038]
MSARPIFTGLSQLPPSARDSLARGEEPLAWDTVALWGEDRIGRSAPPKAIEGFDLNPISAVLSGPVVLDPGLFERWVCGVALTGHTGSVAASLGRALRPLGEARLAVTTERLIVYEEGDLITSKDLVSGRRLAHREATEVWSIARSAVLDATRRSRPFMTGRLIIRFTDFSSAALMCGIFSPRGAHRLRDALRAGE